MKVWLVGKSTIVTKIENAGIGSDGEKLNKEKIVGIFSSEEKAINACRDETYWIAPLQMDEVAPEESTVWTGAYYPKHKET